MTSIPIYQIDAFAAAPFQGNPAAVCPLERFPDDRLLQAIASENNLSETAFIVPEGEDYRLRWFTPAAEVKLCGHATLASAWVVFNMLAPERHRVTFHTLSGPLIVAREGDRLVMDFPADPPAPAAAEPALADALGVQPEAYLQTERDHVAVLADPGALRRLAPDFGKLMKLAKDCVLVTAPGEDGYDCLVRFFAPKHGIPEDPVTGAAHCVIAPYWAERLGRTTIRSWQASPRGGAVDCELLGERVKLAGRCAFFLAGEIRL